MPDDNMAAIISSLLGGSNRFTPDGNQDKIKQLEN